MKIKTDTDIERIAKAIEDDAGHPIDSICLLYTSDAADE